MILSTILQVKNPGHIFAISIPKIGVSYILRFKKQVDCAEIEMRVKRGDKSVTVGLWLFEKWTLRDLPGGYAELGMYRVACRDDIAAGKILVPSDGWSRTQ